MADRSLRASVTLVDLRAATTRVVPVAEVDYVLLAVSATMDTSGRYRYMTDVAVVTEHIALSPSKALTDGSGADDAISISALKLLVDGFAMNDGSEVGDGSVYSLNKGISNITFTAEALAHSLTKLRQDQFVLLDSAAKALSRPLASSLGTDDTVVTAAAKGLSDSAEMQDALTTLLLFLREFADTVSSGDTATLALSLPKAEQAGIADKAILEPLKVLTEAPELADSLTSVFSGSFMHYANTDDARSLLFTSSRVESTTMTDVGVVSVQDYCTLGYFAEDYVGISQAF